MLTLERRRCVRLVLAAVGLPLILSSCGGGSTGGGGSAPSYAYVANYGDGTNPGAIAQFSTQSDGTLTTLTVAVPAGVATDGIVVDPSGQYAYASNYGDGSTASTISQYKIIQGDGALQPMTTSSVNAGIGPWSLTVDPSGQYVYVANDISNDVSAYRIGATGELTQIVCATGCGSTIAANFAAGTYPTSVVVDPGGKYVYVADWGDGTNPGAVSQFTIQADGSLVAMGTPSVNAGVGPIGLTVDPSGKYIYVANFGDNSVSQFTIQADGSLVAMGTPSVGAGSYPSAVAVDPSAKYAYVTNEYGNDLSAYRIGSTGGLTQIACSTGCSTAIAANFAAGLYPLGIAFDPSGKYIYVANYGDGTNSGTASQYSIQSDGSLVSLSTASVDVGVGAYSIATVSIP
jgi:6-phosphogluconolactonase